MNQTDKQTGIHEVYSFEVDEFDFICGPICGGNTFENPDGLTTSQTIPFNDIFSDDSTCSLLSMVLNHVRETSETISYPYRCDTETHCVFLRVIVSKSTSTRVGFLNKVVGYEPRPINTKLVRNFVTDGADYTMCSICNRLNYKDAWREFQELVNSGIWPASEKVMDCSFDTCPDCVNAIHQRIAETHRTYDRQFA